MLVQTSWWWEKSLASAKPWFLGHLTHNLIPIFFLICLVGGGVQLGPLGTAATDWPLVACPRWLWWWRIWWNEDWQGKPKYLEKIRSSATLSTTKPNPHSDLTIPAPFERCYWSKVRYKPRQTTVHVGYMPRMCKKKADHSACGLYAKMCKKKKRHASAYVGYITRDFRKLKQKFTNMGGWLNNSMNQINTFIYIYEMLIFSTNNFHSPYKINIQQCKLKNEAGVLFPYSFIYIYVLSFLFKMLWYDDWKLE
jgi:hypothetical protein